MLLRISDNLRNEIMLQLFTGTPGLFSNTADDFHRIRLMKGAVPTSADDLLDASFRSADRLVQWNTVNDGTWRSVSDDTVTLLSTFAVAEKAGLATWLWWVSRSVAAQTATATNSRDMIMTVGDTGSGEDIEMNPSDRNIVIDSSYRIEDIVGITLTMPEAFS